jgi:hypothetical protein
LPCAGGARQTPVYARQTFCRTFSIAPHGKARTAAICTAKWLCRVLFIARTANIFAVRQSRLTAKKPRANGSGVRLRHVARFAVRRVSITHGKVLNFAVRLLLGARQRLEHCRASSARRTAKNGTIAVRLLLGARQRMALLPCAPFDARQRCQGGAGMVTLPCALLSGARQSDQLVSFFFGFRV